MKPNDQEVEKQGKGTSRFVIGIMIFSVLMMIVSGNALINGTPIIDIESVLQWVNSLFGAE